VTDPFAPGSISREERRSLLIEDVLRTIDSFPVDELMELVPDSIIRAHEADVALRALRSVLSRLEPRPVPVHYPKDWL
jgi:hypothetical protein